MALDPTTPLGKVRLRIGDWSDLPMLPDVVITSTLADCNDSVGRASQRCAQYILATLTSKTHKKLAQLETWSGEQFNNYVKYLQITVLNPNFMEVAPIPYTGPQFSTVHPIIQFVEREQVQTEIYEAAQGLPTSMPMDFTTADTTDGTVIIGN